jgi:hypothetical protein
MAEQEKPKKKSNLKPEELEYIRQNCLSKSDEEIANYLNRDIRTVCNARKKLGIKKVQGGRLDVVRSNDTNGTLLPPSQRMTEDQRKEFFKTQLTNSLYYNNLKEQFEKDEIDFYLEEWASLCVQFEDIVATEKRQIDELIKAEIMGNRILRNVKITEEEIENMIKEVQAWRAAHDMENDEEAQDRDNALMSMIRSMSAQSHAMSSDYQKNVDLKNRLLNELNARRRDRVDQLKKSGTTFLSLVESLRERETREQQGRHIELVRLAKEKKRADWRQPTKFPDGTDDCVLMDEESILPTKDVVRLSEMGSRFVEEMSKEAGKKILVIEDDHRRKQFFQTIFKNNNIIFASNNNKAKKRMEEHSDLDMICVDYDIGYDQKSSESIEHILDNDLYPNTKFLVHSMNKTGANQLKNMLTNNRIVEVVPFEEIVKTFGDTNA